MTFHRILIMLYVVSMVTTKVVSTQGTDLGYNCHLNGTITVENPGAYDTAFAYNNSDICSSTYNEDFSSLTITGCGWEERIVVYFSNMSLGSNMLLGGEEDLAVYTILCREPEDTLTKTAMLGFTPRANSTEEPSVSPEFSVTSQIYTDAYANVTKVSAITAEAMYWQIRGSASYDHKPMECKAYPGLVVNSSSSHTTMIVDGCSQKASVVTDFEIGASGKSFATIYGFRYIASPYVTIECVVRICLTGDSACKINNFLFNDTAHKVKDCVDGRRRRRRRTDDLPTDEYEVVSTTLKVTEPGLIVIPELEMPTIYIYNSSSTIEISWKAVIAAFGVVFLVAMVTCANYE